MASSRATLVLLIPGRAAINLDLQLLVRQGVLVLLVIPMVLGALARRGYEALNMQAPLVLVASEALGSLHRAQLPLRAHAPGERVRVVARQPAPGHKEGLARMTRAALGSTISAAAVMRAFGVRRTAEPQPDGPPVDAFLRLTATHLGESLRVQPFSADGMPNPEAFAAITHLMRCRVTGEEVPADPALVRILVALGSIYRRPLNLISGHRAVHANGTSPTSQHTLGTAADIKIPGVSIEELRKQALALGARGIGLYPEKNFVHIDVRQKRKYSWIYTEADGEQPYVERVQLAATQVVSDESAGSAAGEASEGREAQESGE